MKKKRKKPKPHTYRLPKNSPLKVEGDFAMTEWSDGPPDWNAKIRWSWTPPSHAHCVMFNYGP